MQPAPPRWLGIALAVLGCLVGATSAHSGDAWVLWARTCNVKTQTCTGPWRRRDSYEAERWCRAARATLVNQAFTQEGRETAQAPHVKRIDIVAHSMGGLIGLYYVKKLGGHARAVPRRLVQLSIVASDHLTSLASHDRYRSSPCVTGRASNSGTS